MKYKIIILFLLITASCTNKKEEIKIENELSGNELSISNQQFINENMKLGKVVSHNFLKTITTNGLIEVPPNNIASISSYKNGYVNNVAVLVGDYVKKGDVLVNLSSPEYISLQEEFLEKSAKLSFLEKDFNRKKQLFQDNLISKKNYLKVENDYKSTLINVNGLTEKLKLLNINIANLKSGKIASFIPIQATISGYISEVNITKGSYVTSATKMIEIINTDHIHIELKVFEKDVMDVKKDQQILFKVPESSNKTFKAKITLVGNTIKNNRTVKVHAHIEEEGLKFIAGMFIEAEIIVDSKTSLSLPNSSIYKENDSTYILVLKEKNKDNYIFEKLPIKLGLKDDEFSEVLGIKDIEAKNILIAGNYML